MIPFFNLAVPKAIKGVDSKLLNQRNLWPDAAAWDAAAKSLSEKFINNFSNFTDTEEGKKLVAAGPQL